MSFKTFSSGLTLLFGLLFMLVIVVSPAQAVPAVATEDKQASHVDPQIWVPPPPPWRPPPPPWRPPPPWMPPPPVWPPPPMWPPWPPRYPYTDYTE
ncbi:hypothetical protein BCR42DRAFT_401537 [Absidia repens]|uniref:Uncharacterized protein n=1 Tax=Absidia repens TaxID=90262 RepID=A0A1X2J2L7_9FUNG|nr:hypothetical protein BCR42DRAFT_401537 [Absidia repens]